MPLTRDDLDTDDLLYTGTGAAVPSIMVEADFTNEPTNPTRVWTRLDDIAGTDPVSGRAIATRVRSGSWVRAGRTIETQQTQAGALQSLVLDNRDGIFDRLNEDGPFYGPLDWAFWVRVSMVWDGVQYVRWTGIKDKFLGNRPYSGRDRYRELVGDDTMKLLELFPLSALAYPIQGTGARVSAVLASAGIPAGTINSGKPTCVEPAVSFLATDSTSALQHLQNVEQDERGYLFAQPDGTLDFQDRYYRANQILAGPTATLGETDGDLRYTEGDTDDDSEYLYDVCAVTPGGDTPTIQIATNSDFQAKQFARRLDLSMLCESGVEAMSNAQYYVNRYGQPWPYLHQMSILGGRDPSTWPTIFDARNSDLFAFEGAGSATVWAYLERVTESWTPGQPLQVLWDMSPAKVVESTNLAGREVLWKLGLAGLSELGPTTKLG